MQPERQSEDNEHPLELAVAGVAGAMAEPSRVKILCALMDGRAWTATELSVVADVAPSTASAHLLKLINGGLIACHSRGRHRYYRLAGHEIAALLENLMGVSWQSIARPPVTTPVRLRTARTCYDHLAGEVAVQIYDFLLSGQWITAQGDGLTDTGKTRLAALGVETALSSRRKICCACLDWSERCFHLGGQAGAALLAAFEKRGWVQKHPGNREITLTHKGRAALEKHFAVRF